MNDQNNEEANEIVDAPQNGEKPKEQSTEELFEDTTRNNDRLVERIQQNFAGLEKSSHVDLTGERKQLDNLSTELGAITTATRKSLRDRVKDRVQGGAQFVADKKDKAIGAVASIAEKVDEEKAWEHIRKPQLIKLFTEAGFEKPDQTAEVVRYLEARMDFTYPSFNKNSEQIGTKTDSYRFDSRDVEMIRKITEGVENPMQFLNQVQNIVDLPIMGTLEKFSDYIEIIKNTPNIQDFLNIASQLGPIRKYWEHGIPKNEFMRRYGPGGLDVTHDPLLELLQMDKATFQELFSSETVTWIRDFNVSRIDEYNRAMRESPNGKLQPKEISILELQDLAKIAAKGEESKAYLKEFLSKMEENDLYSLYKAVEQFKSFTEVFPEGEKLHAAGFDISESYRMYGISDRYKKVYSRSDLVPNEDALQKLLNNPVYLKNARLLADYGYSFNLFGKYGEDSIYKTEDFPIFEKAVKIGASDEQHRAVPVEALKDIIEDIKRRVNRIGGLKEGSSLDEYIDDDGVVTAKFIDSLAETVKTNGTVHLELRQSLTPEVIAKMSEQDQNFWNDYRTLDHGGVGGLGRLMLLNKNNEQFFKDGRATYSLIEEALSENLNSASDIGHLMRPELMSTLPPEDVELLEALIKYENFSVREFLYANKGEINTYIKNGIPTIELIDAFAQKDNPYRLLDLSVLLTDEVIENLRGESKEFWSFYKSSDIFGGFKDFLIENKERFGEFVIDGKLTRPLVQQIADEHNTTLMINLLEADPAIFGDEFTDVEKNAIEKWRSLTFDLQRFIIESGTNFPFITENEYEALSARIEIMQRVQESPSLEIKRLEKEICEQLISIDDPLSAFTQIEEIFIKNNLPLVGKVYRIFETLYANPRRNSGALLEEMIQDPNLSPQLQEATPKERRNIIYQDLLRVHVESDNPSLRKFIGIIAETQGLMDRIQGDSGSVDSLTLAEQEKLRYFLNKMDTLYINSLFGRTVEARKRERDSAKYNGPSTSHLALPDRITVLQKNFRVRSDQKMTDRLIEMFASPLGKESLDEVLETMGQSKTIADNRNRTLVQEGSITVSPGDLIKGVQGMYIDNILQNGSVAKEYLGSSAASDSTPFDTDVSMIFEGDGVIFSDAWTQGLSRGYGTLQLLIRDRGQFNGESGYELFDTKVLGPRHYGIRTGFASTEIDAILDMQDDVSEREKVQFSIARNGFYIPLLDRNGTIVFTPEMYDEYRKTFAGVKDYSSEIPTVTPLSETPRVSPEVVQATENQVRTLVTEIQSGMGEIESARGKVRAIVQEVLEERGVTLRASYDTSIYGAEFDDTGSTGRNTNIPGDFDFDLSLRLDGRDARRMDEITDEIKRRLNPEEDKSHAERDREYIQIRAIKSHIEGLDPLDIDIGVGRRSDAEFLASHDAVRAKLESIRENYGDEQYFDVLGNIVLAKQVLKSAHVYKKGAYGEGGLGGIGVENWVLANGGNMLEAFRTFYETALVDGAVIPMEEFKRKYKVFDAGTNLKQADLVEDHIAKLTEQGYQGMLSAIGEYLQGQSVLDEESNR